MTAIKPGKIAFIMLLMTFGAGYFSIFSSLNLNPVLKDVLVLVPIQLGVLAYIVWLKLNKASDN